MCLRPKVRLYPLGQINLCQEHDQWGMFVVAQKGDCGAGLWASVRPLSMSVVYCTARLCDWSATKTLDIRFRWASLVWMNSPVSSHGAAGRINESCLSALGRDSRKPGPGFPTRSFSLCRVLLKNSWACSGCGDLARETTCRETSSRQGVWEPSQGGGRAADPALNTHMWTGKVHTDHRACGSHHRAREGPQTPLWTPTCRREGLQRPQEGQAGGQATKATASQSCSHINKEPGTDSAGFTNYKGSADFMIILVNSEWARIHSGRMKKEWEQVPDTLKEPARPAVWLQRGREKDYSLKKEGRIWW